LTRSNPTKAIWLFEAPYLAFAILYFSKVKIIDYHRKIPQALTVMLAALLQTLA
jgi:hypothetical protein